MSLRFFIFFAAAAFSTPVSIAHEPEGTFKNYCEDPSEWGTHDYAPIANGIFNFLIRDGNLVGDCDGDTVPADFDGHTEWSQGGALMHVTSGDGLTSGSLACYGVLGHHPTFGPFLAMDVTLGAGVPYFVAADTSNLLPPTNPAEPNCGDGFLDENTVCVGFCHVTFTEGLDGAYSVNVGNLLLPGTMGHAYSPGFFGPTSALPCLNTADEDRDGQQDWLSPLTGSPDKNCSLPTDDEDSRGNALTPVVGECMDFVDNDNDDERDWVDLIGFLHLRGDADQCASPLDQSERP